MNTNKKDGGPAFPYAFEHDEPPQSGFTPGMSLRDWFAGQALAGISASVASASLHNSAQTPPDEHIAGWAYAYADEMLAARSKEAGK